MSDPDPLEIALRVAGVLERLAVRYVLGGSLASTAFGEPRATLDVDFAADVLPSHVAPLIAELAPEFSIQAEWTRHEVARRGSFQMVHGATMLRVDVFVPPWTGVHLWKWQHRRRVVLQPGDRGIDVTAPEGIVVQKLTWYRDGGGVSDRQWRDVLGVLKTQGAALDVPAVREWSARLGVTDLLQRALAEAGLAGDAP